MAKKKREPAKQNPKRQKKKEREGELQSGLPDPREVERMFQELLAVMEDFSEDDSPLSQAQELVSRAYEEEDIETGLELARQALMVCPDCADAFVFLAENTSSRKEARQLFDQGVAAGVRAIGREEFKEYVGNFWGYVETRPYMRARKGLAHCLWGLGRCEAAVMEFWAMLHLNPNDDQGVRDALAGYLLLLDRDDELSRLLDRYPDTNATWRYTRALLAYRQNGAGTKAKKFLTQAKKINKHIPAYLLGEKSGSDERLDYYSSGEESEAQYYCNLFRASWKFTPGAMAWLEESTIARKKPAPRFAEPDESTKEQLRCDLGQEEEVWQVGIQFLPSRLLSGREPLRAWALFVTSPQHGLVILHALREEEPNADFLWDLLVVAMTEPAAREPHRPSKLQVRPGPGWEELRPHLEDIGITLELTDTLPHADEVMEGMIQRISQREMTGILDMAGVTPAMVGGLFSAAADFYRNAPWKRVDDRVTVKVECDKFQSGPWNALILGQSGYVAGLALFENWEVWRENIRGDVDGTEAMREGVTTSLLFGEEWKLPGSDVEACTQYGWEVAGPDAFPLVYHKERGLTVRRLLGWQLELLDGCLRALPAFILQTPQDVSTRAEIVVPVVTGQLKLAFSWQDP